MPTYFDLTFSLSWLENDHGYFIGVRLNRRNLSTKEHRILVVFQDEIFFLTQGGNPGC